jgi:hypothetical protein
MQQVDETAIPHSLEMIDAQPAIYLAGPSCLRHEVAGEAYRPQEMQRLTAALRGRTDQLIAAWLIPEPENPHDRSAVGVWVLGGRVGYLPRELAAAWEPVLSRLRARYARHAACRASLDAPSPANQGSWGVIVWLPALPTPAALQPAASRATPAPSSATEIARLVAELEHLRGALESTTQERDALKTKLAATILPEERAAEIESELKDKHAQLDAARRELDAVEEALEIQSFGFYTPKYGFESSAQYTVRLKSIRQEQKLLIKQGKAAPCDAKWTVGGSAAEGKKLVKQQAKLMLRAFNGESDAAIAKARYDNVTKLEQRLTKAYNSINELGEVQRVFISRRYFELKLAELHLVHEHREKVHEEKEEQRRLREKMREEQRVQEEISRAKAEAEKEEAQSAAALEKARAELAAAEETSKQHARLEGLVTRLETELEDALDRKAKAIARAQLTKSGHVYVLSNIGSFGDGVYKIGLTRRLDPLERVTELGDASVPFPFDVHAIIYAEDAPGLEAKLHQAFDARRVNSVNRRKEYFRATLDEIRAEVERHHGFVSFQLTTEAEEYRKTRAFDAASQPAEANPSSVRLAREEVAGEQRKVSG